MSKAKNVNVETATVANETEILNMRKATISAALVTRIDAKIADDSSKITAGNMKKLQKMRAFCERNDAALTLLAEDNADTTFVGKQIYANEKLVDFLKVAVHGHINVEMLSPAMHHFMLRALKTFKRLQDANVTIDYMNVIKCAMKGDLKPTNNGELYLLGKVGYSSEATQSCQVLNAFKTLRIIDETIDDKTKRVNLATKAAQAVLAAIENYDGKEIVKA